MDSVQTVSPNREPYGRLPLAFETNQGQSDPRVKFVSRGQAYALFLTETGATLSLRGESRDAAVTMSLEGARKHPRITGIEALQGRVNYFRGGDRSKWRTNIPTYGRVRYEDVYRGIDLVYYGTDATPGSTGRVATELEYDFIVAPGADPSRIRFSFEGAEKIAIADNGDLVLTTAAGELRHRRPFIYQEVDGKRVEVAGGYRLSNPESRLPNPGTTRVSFSVSSYDASLPLVIDPTLAYSTYLGGSGGGSAVDRGRGIAVDAAGAAYVTGFTYSTDFPTTPGAFDTTPTPGTAFVTKLNSTGTSLVYSTVVGSPTYTTQAYAIAIDSAGSAYITGYTENGLPTTTGAFSETHSGGNQNGDAFVTKLAPDGASLVYSTYLGGISSDYGLGIAVDAAGAAYVTGPTSSADFPTTPGADDVSHNGGTDDAFVTKVAPDGATLAYSTFLGGNGIDSGLGIAVDATGAAFVAGNTKSANFPVTGGAYDVDANGFTDPFVVRVNPAGSDLLYATYLGGTGDDGAAGIAVDSAGNAYVVGDTWSAGFPTTVGAAHGGANDAYVVKLNATGTAPVYATLLGGTASDAAYAVAINGAGEAFVTGQTRSANFPTTLDALDTTFNGQDADAFFSKLAATGTLSYSTFLGASTDSFFADIGYAIALDSSGAAYLTGQTGGTANNFPLTSGVWDSTFTGDTEAFIAKFSFGTQIGSLTLSPSTIFPADRRYKRVTISATDTLGSPLACTIQGVTQNTPQQSVQIDYVIINATTVDLRAERPVGGVNRKYTIAVTCGGTPTQAVIEVTGVRQ